MIWLLLTVSIGLTPDTPDMIFKPLTIPALYVTEAQCHAARDYLIATTPPVNGTYRHGAVCMELDPIEDAKSSPPESKVL